MALIGMDGMKSKPSLEGGADRVAGGKFGTPTIVPCWQVFDPWDQVGTL